MAKKEYPPWHYHAAAALAGLIGLTYTFSLFNPILGPGFLAVAVVFLVIGVRKQREKDAALAVAKAPPPS